MKCVYCNFYYTGQKIEKDNHFCSEKRSIVSKLDTTCEKFAPAPFFWCHNTNCWIDVNICTARQTKEAEECKKCRQKQDILEIRRAIGRKSKSLIRR